MQIRHAVIAHKVLLVLKGIVEGGDPVSTAKHQHISLLLEASRLQQWEGNREGRRHEERQRWGLQCAGTLKKIYQQSSVKNVLAQIMAIPRCLNQIQ